MFVDVNDLTTVHAAMQALCDYLVKENIPPECVFDSRLVASELLGNVLRHGKGKARLHLRIEENKVELKIESDSVFYQKTPCAELYAEGGRGLFLVENICKEEIFKEEDGLRVYIRINKI